MLASTHCQGARALSKTCLLLTNPLIPLRHAPAAACPPKDYTSRVLGYTVHAVVGVLTVASGCPDDSLRWVPDRAVLARVKARARISHTQHLLYGLAF